MATSKSFPEILLNAFQEVSEEIKMEKKLKKLQPNPKNNNKRKIKKKQNKFHNKKMYKKKENNQINLNINKDNQIKNDKISDLQNFVVTILKISPKKKMLLFELTTKISDTFDKTIKQLTGKKSNIFFNEMKHKQLIDIINDGAFDYAVLYNTNKNMENHVDQNIVTNVDKDMVQHIDDINKNVDPDKNVDNDMVQKMDDIDKNTKIIRNEILNTLSVKKSGKIMLSAINSYCFRYIGVAWKNVMNKKPKEFINDMVNDNLIVLKSDINKHPYIMLNNNNQINIKLASNQNNLNNRKRKRNDNDKICNEPNIKKRKINDNNNNNKEIIHLETIELNIKDNDAINVETIKKEFKDLKNKHDVHFHFTKNYDD